MTREEESFLAFATTLANYSRHLEQCAKASWINVDKRQHEPEVIKEYLLAPGVGIDFLNQHFSEYFCRRHPRFSLKFSSIYIHQKPYVHRLPGVHAYCELGDLCTIFVYVDKHKNIRHARGMILQAKKGRYFELDSLDQRLLYDEAPRFKYKANSFRQQTFDKSSSRELPAYQNGRALGLKFLHVRIWKEPRAYSPPVQGKKRQAWGGMIYKLITGSEGLQFFPGAPKHDAWSAILDDLIRMGLHAVKPSKQRANKTELNDLIDIFNHFESYDKYSAVTEEESAIGLPIMFAIVQDKELDAE